tara:strand:+ start:315 stop:1166 length:852 start_codon:yes stop_codon:yes gene_type:complete
MISKTSVYLAGTATPATILASVLVAVASMLAPETTDAQTAIIGKHKLPSVVVDHSVLENIRNTSDLNQLQKAPINSGILPANRRVRSNDRTIRPEVRGPNTITSISDEKRDLPQEVKRVLKAVKSYNNVPLHSRFKSNAPRQAINKPRSKLQSKIQNTDAVVNKLGRPKNPAKDVKTYLSPRQQFQVVFGTGSAILGKKEGLTIDAIAASLKQRNSLRVQLLAYADGAAGTLSQTRRLSLSRALSVRSHLINQGIPSTRIDVRALGNKYKDGPADRVDVIVTR